MSLRSTGQRTLLETVETQRLGCELAGSPLYAAILDVVAVDVKRKGRYAHLLEPVASAPFGDAVVLRLLSGLHLLALDGRAPELAEQFPSAGGAPDRGLERAVLEAAKDHADELRLRLEQGVQTNEVGRSAALLGGYLEVARLGLPLRVLEVGASAGLNLLWDRYRYVMGDQSFGPVDSPLSFDRPWFAESPDLATPVAVVSRRGCDVQPISLGTAEGRLRLRSFVWPDQLDRMARLDAAIQVAAIDQPVVDRASAAAWLGPQLADAVPGTSTVITHSIVFQYLAGPEREDLLRLIDTAGAHATPDAPVAWLRLEPGGDQAELRLTMWPGGTTRVLATSAYHGPPVVWRPAGGAVRR